MARIQEPAPVLAPFCSELEEKQPPPSPTVGVLGVALTLPLEHSVRTHKNGCKKWLFRVSEPRDLNVDLTAPLDENLTPTNVHLALLSTAGRSSPWD